MKQVELPQRFDGHQLQRGEDGRITLSATNLNNSAPCAAICSPKAVIKAVIEAVCNSADVAIRTKYTTFSGRSNCYCILFSGDGFSPYKRGNKRNTTATRFTLLNYGAEVFRSERWVELSLVAAKEDSAYLGLLVACCVGVVRGRLTVTWVDDATALACRSAARLP